jgi:hypothetical protein
LKEKRDKNKINEEQTQNNDKSRVDVSINTTLNRQTTKVNTPINADPKPAALAFKGSLWPLKKLAVAAV